MSERKAVLIKKDFIKPERLDRYTPEEIGQIFISFLKNVNGIDDELEDRELSEKVYELLDYDREYGEEPYQRQVERNRINGAKGGRPKKQEEPKETHDNPVGLEQTQKSQINKNKIKEISTLNTYTNNELLKAKIQEFIDYRQKVLKKSVKSIENLLKMLDRCATTDEEKIQVLSQSIEQEWQGLFPLKKQSRPNSKADIIEHNYGDLVAKDPRKKYMSS